MNGWVFAGAALATILAFEFVLFYYFSPDRPTRAHSSHSEHSGASTNVTGAGAAGGGHQHGTVRDASEDAESVECHHCGTHNVDGAMVVFCQFCLGRLP